MSKKVGNKMIEFDMQDLFLPEINLMKYVNQNVMYKFLPRNVQRMIEALTTKGEYVLDWIILRKVEQYTAEQSVTPTQEVVPNSSEQKDGQPKDTTKEEDILENF